MRIIKLYIIHAYLVAFTRVAVKNTFNIHLLSISKSEANFDNKLYTIKMINRSRALSISYYCEINLLYGSL